MLFGIIGSIVLLMVVVFWAVATYNGLVSLRGQCENAWAQIDVQLKRRYDLIPNLVETVKGYASHERETLDAVISARAKAVQTHDSSGAGVGEQARAEGELSQALGRLMVVSEAYPDLKANQNFSQLQEELTSTENKIGFARQHYNDTTTTYNIKIEQIPANIIAGLGNFRDRELFELEDAAQREAPSVSFS
ncbi:MAG: LemA family protein [Planctomycetota bacterium]